VGKSKWPDQPSPFDSSCASMPRGLFPPIGLNLFSESSGPGDFVACRHPTRPALSPHPPLFGSSSKTLISTHHVFISVSHGVGGGPHAPSGQAWPAAYATDHRPWFTRTDGPAKRGKGGRDRRNGSTALLTSTLTSPVPFALETHRQTHIHALLSGGHRNDQVTRRWPCLPARRMGATGH